jgi:hypothetical protein
MAPPGIGYPPQTGGFNGQAAKPPNPPHSNIVKKFANWNVCFSCGFDVEEVLDIRSSIRYLDHFYSYPLMPSMTRSGVLQVRAPKRFALFLPHPRLWRIFC